MRIDGHPYGAPWTTLLRAGPRRDASPTGSAPRPNRAWGDSAAGAAAVLRPAAADARESPAPLDRATARSSTVLWALAGLTALGVAVRFASLGVQSYHHDEVITAARVIPGEFEHMLRQVKGSESNPPLYYVLAWGWAKAFGTGEIGLRSLSALFGAATVPVAYLIGRELASRRAGLIAAAIVAVNPMLIWYSQEARSYALLVFFGALSLLFFVRALRSGGAGPGALGAGLGAGALQPLLRRLRGRDRGGLAAGRAALPMARGPARRRRRRRGRPGAAAADLGPGQPDPHRLDRPQPAPDAASSRPASASWPGRPAT